MKKTDQLTAQDFQALVGATFQLAHKPVSLESVDIREAPTPEHRAPASITFVADEEIDVEHGTHLLSHPELGDHLLHIHRVNGGEKPTYELIIG